MVSALSVFETLILAFLVGGVVLSATVFFAALCIAYDAQPARPALLTPMGARPRPARLTASEYRRIVRANKKRTRHWHAGF